MLFTTNTNRVALLPLPLLILATFLALAGSSSALPTAKSNRRAAALFEPLFAPANPQVGPSRSIERLRLRRSLSSIFGNQPTAEKVAVVKSVAQPVRNPKAKRSAISSSSPALLNPKKRSVAPSTVQNPKKRSVSVPAVQNPKQKRSLAPSAPAVRLNPKKRSLVKVAPLVAEAPSRRGKFLSLVRRILSGEQIDSRLEARAIGVPRVIPNPKNPAFSEYCATVTAPVTTTTSKAASTTSKAAATTTKAATTTTKASTTTTKASTTTKNTTTTTQKPTTTVKAATTTTKATTTKTTTTVAPVATHSGWPSSGGLVAGGYYPDWQSETLPVSSINFDMYDLINFSFAVPTSTFDVQFIGWNSASLLRELVARAHAKNTKVLIAIGGWSDSEHFSNAVSNSNNRAKFVKNIVNMVNTYGVDGVDIDWEYPGSAGDTNDYTSADTANFLLFLQALRTALGKDMHISSCANQRAFIGANGSPLADVSSFAKVLDNVLVMNYDVWGASSTPGANAPLKDSCANSMQPDANMLSSIKAWTGAGMPASKILMGVPAYGYISSSSKTSLVHKRDQIPTPDSDFKPMSNRERAARAHADERAAIAEQNMSPFRRAFQEGHKAAEERRRQARALKRSERRVVEKDFVKRAEDAPVYCPNNHSKLPCAGVQDQNITEIGWNPLDDLRNNTGPIKIVDGIFSGNIGKTKLGKGDLSGLEGNQIDFWKLVNYGVLAQNGKDFTAINGYTRGWDDCSSTPYLYDTSRKVVITYDDPASMAKKGALALEQKIAGIMMWEMSGDTTDWQLAQAWRGNMGLTRLGV